MRKHKGGKPAALRLTLCVQAGQNANAAVSNGCCNKVKKYVTDPDCLGAIMLSKTGMAHSDIMTVEERIEAEGNELFKEDKLAEAMQQYEMALAYVGDDFHVPAV
eukprot:Gb_34270 [translate_table: standard]